MSSESDSDEFDLQFVSKAAKRTQGMYKATQFDGGNNSTGVDV